MIDSNERLRQAVRDCIESDGRKMSWIAESLGMSRQGLNNLLNKRNFSLDDANMILAVIGKRVTCDVSHET